MPNKIIDLIDEGDGDLKGMYACHACPCKQWRAPKMTLCPLARGTLWCRFGWLCTSQYD